MTAARYGTLHHVSEAAGSLWPRSPPREKPEGQAVAANRGRECCADGAAAPDSGVASECAAVGCETGDLSAGLWRTMRPSVDCRDAPVDVSGVYQEESHLRPWMRPGLRAGSLYEW